MPTEPSLLGELAALFVSAFVAATVLPAASEATLAAVVALGETPAVLAVGVATVGNTLGSVVNWVLGRFFSHWVGHRYFPLSQSQFERFQRWYERWGVWSLLLSWVPVVGDPLTVVAGIARTPLWLFAIIVAVAKLARYVAIAAGVSFLM